MTANRFSALVYFLGAALLILVAGTLALSYAGKPVDDIYKQAITGLITGLLGLFARMDDRVTVANTPNQPVPVDPK